MKTIKCSICGKDFQRHRPDYRTIKFTCSKECLHHLKLLMNTKETIIKSCLNCGQPARIPYHRKDKNGCCSIKCTREYSSKRLSALNKELNPHRMTPATKEKLRNSQLGRGEGKTYTKYFGKHEHRVVAEQKLGRPLLKGEIVHHKDENKKNNHPDNIHIFPSQAEHARYHALKKKGKEYEI